MIGFASVSILLLNVVSDRPIRSADPSVIDDQPIASYASADGKGAWRVVIYVRSDTSRPDRQGRFPPIHLARFSRWPQVEEQSTEVMWADSASCPKLIGVIAAVENLVAPQFDVGPFYGTAPEGSEIQPAIVSPADGQGFSIQARARQADGSMATMVLSSSSGGIASFGHFAVRQMADCWSPTKPAWPPS